MSFMSKFIMQGEEAGEVLNYLSTANVNKCENTISYTQWLNDEGKLEADLTVSKLDNGTYFVVATDTMKGHVLQWMRRHTRGRHAFVTDVTGAYAQINIQGPKSRELLQRLTSVDMSNDSFPFRTIREIDIGYARVLCARITYVGELGYELFIPTEQAIHVYERIVNIGDDFDLKHVGLKALNSLRLEKGYRDYGHDIDNTDDILSAGLSFTCDFEKENGFIGRAAVLENKKNPLCSRLVQVLVKDPNPMIFHGEVLKRNGVPVGDIRSGSYGHSLGGAVGLAMVHSPDPINLSYLKQGEWSIDIAGVEFPLQVSLKPLYDPKNLKIKS